MTVQDDDEGESVSLAKYLMLTLAKGNNNMPPVLWCYYAEGLRRTKGS